MTDVDPDLVIKQLIDPFGPGTDDPELTKLEVFLCQVMHYVRRPGQADEDITDQEVFKVADWMQQAMVDSVTLRMILTKQIRPEWKDGELHLRRREE
jgi:hypothetical protein